VSAGEFVQSPCVRGSRIAGERTAECDHGPDIAGYSLSDLTREDAPETPADQADFCSVTPAQIVDSVEDALLQAVEIAVVATEFPAVRGISFIPEEPSQRPGGDIARHQAWQYEDRMAVAARSQPQQRQRSPKRQEFVKSSALHKQQQSRRGPGV